METLTWKDTLEIAIRLADEHTDIDPRYIRFTDLHKWVVVLEVFIEDPNKSNEKIL